jgi:hypothetical protein
MRDAFAALLVATGLTTACSGSGEEPSTGSTTSPVTASAPTITFGADWSQSASALVAGSTAQVSYDASRLTTCRGNLGYGGSAPGWSIDGDYSMNGIVFYEPLGVAGAGLQNEHLPAGALPSLSLPFAGTLQMWFENTDVFGCVGWDSNYGRNYAFSVAPPAGAPGWVGNASVLVDRATCGSGAPCWGDATAADGGATFDTWARQQAAVTMIFFDVWKSGTTDFDNPDLWKELDVEAHNRPAAAVPFGMDYVSFREREGNNARYAVDLRALDLLPGAGGGGGALTSASQCPPIPATITADGQYVQADMDVYFTVNGVALQPAGGGAFRVHFENYAGLYAVCSFPQAAP